MRYFEKKKQIKLSESEEDAIVSAVYTQLAAIKMHSKTIKKSEMQFEIRALNRVLRKLGRL